MLVNPNFTFTLNVSTGQFPEKKPGKVWEIQFSPQQVTIPDLESLEKTGKVFCYNFKQVADSGLITQHEKTLAGFDYTNAIFFDIDKMPVPMQVYVSGLQYKPSLAYTTYSNGKATEFYRYGFRLVYVFDDPIKSITEFDSLYYAIAAANNLCQRKHPDGTKYEFDYRKVNQQYYGGGTNSESLRTDIIYSISDFTGYVEAGMSLMKSLHPTKAKSKPKTTAGSPCQNNIRKKEENYIKGQAYYSEVDSPFYKDLSSMSPKEFILKYEPIYHKRYMQSLSTPLILSKDGKYFLYPDDYQEIKRNWGYDETGKRCVRPWLGGSGRRKRLYVTAQIMKFNVPDISREELIYNLVVERYYYYDNSDKKLSNSELKRIVDNALAIDFNLSPCKHPAFKVNPEYCIANDINGNQAKNMIRSKLKESQILAHYDFSMSVQDNLRMLKDKGIKVCRSYLFKLKKKYENAGSPCQNNIEKQEENQAYYSETDSKSMEADMFDALLLDDDDSDSPSWWGDVAYGLELRIRQSYASRGEILYD